MVCSFGEPPPESIQSQTAAGKQRLKLLRDDCTAESRRKADAPRIFLGGWNYSAHPYGKQRMKLQGICPGL
jgi:hypothetical protein